jgi:hypothetical protein
LVVEELNLTNQEYLEHLAMDSQAAVAEQLPVTLAAEVVEAQVVQEWMHEATAILIIQETEAQAVMAVLAVLVTLPAQQ